MVLFDPRVLPSLAAASNAQLADVRPEENGEVVEWKALDVQATTIALLSLVFGIRTAKDSARRGGMATSEAKAATARANGAKGGRPPNSAGIQRRILDLSKLDRPASFTTKAVQKAKPGGKSVPAKAAAKR